MERDLTGIADWMRDACRSRRHLEITVLEDARAFERIRAASDIVAQLARVEREHFSATLDPNAAILLRHLDDWATHERACQVQDCGTCLAAFNLVMKAHTVWANSQRHATRRSSAQTTVEETPG